MAYVINALNPPPLDGVAYWERTADPTHPKAFNAVFTPFQMINMFGEKACSTRRKEGWMAIDWHENSIGFVADGTEIAVDLPIVILDIGPFGKQCAYGATNYTELRERHAQMLAERK